MEKKYLVANWKMHKTMQEATTFIERLLPQLDAMHDHPLDLFIAPSFVYLWAIKTLINGRGFIKLAAQNCHHETEGAFTGEVSAAMLASVGVGSVLIGHSERRVNQQEDNVLLAKKIKQVLAAGMRPLLCCGESLEARKEGKHKVIVQQQLQESLLDLTPLQVESLLIAYEPVWAIGRGQVASLEVITEMHAFIRACLLNYYGMLGEKIPILYGGSCNSQNARAIFSCPNVAGGLVGGAGLQEDHLMQIITVLLEK